MAKSSFFSALAWIVLVLGFLLGIIMGFVSQDSVANINRAFNLSLDSGAIFVWFMFTAWISVGIIDVLLFYFASSLHHLEQINANTSKLLNLSVKSISTVNVNAINTFKANEQDTSNSNSTSTVGNAEDEDELKFRCLLCGKKYAWGDYPNVCPNCQKFL